MSDTNKNKGVVLIQKLIKSMNDNTYVACVGRVVKYYEADKTADVQPLELDEDNKKGNNMLLGCLVTKQVQQRIVSDGLNKDGDPKVKFRKLKKGDEVIVLFTDGDLDNYSKGEYTAASDRKHSINDGVVIGNL